MSDTKSNTTALDHKSVSEDEEGGRASEEGLQGTPVPIDEDEIAARMNNLDPPFLALFAEAVGSGRRTPGSRPVDITDISDLNVITGIPEFSAWHKDTVKFYNDPTTRDSET
ncbi:Beta-ketoacyl synthase domain-containing protein [Colletotrichum higginsianum IMI 349063]|uniref:Beta-ketoacyl synthase domain-containing protein n=1 Tax=Colletotrichum higginsianum (strain IMI 349063) TaxID=759273 RepID=A0A1B7YSQ8_COLHI|nr:Beta-ketoacyl synthase domain-containing protein [Colletotrichum higginsianum IMI 349063]OBR15079.1 Beta-ketoacyl synthase domain-containing protein [Colletotrichum higginsianum IMI 349063]